jgi:hypothetical protein
VKEWIFSQIYHFNILTIIVMITFVTNMSKTNNMKLLKEQSSEIYNEIEEVKQEIWRATNGGKS